VILGVVLVAVVASVPLAGGRLAALASTPLHATGALAAAVAAQVAAAVAGGRGPAGVAAALHVASYVLAAAWVVCNRHLTGIALVALGGALNAVAIAVNGGVMPVRPGAAATAGMAEDVATNAAVLPAAQLWFLGDVFAVPAAVPLATAFSAGDVLLVAGLAVVLHVRCGSRPAAWAARRRRRRR
jgi:hypothetical protein